MADARHDHASERKRRHVFLSYRSLERAFAVRLAAALRNSGVSVWVDCLQDGIRPGDDWPRTLEQALNECASMIAVLSPDYAASKICLRELHRADQLGRPIFPVLLRALSPADWPLAVERLQYVDFTAATADLAFAAAVERLVERVSSSPASVIGQRPDPEQQYLLTLIADLEARGGVSQYIALEADLRPDDEVSEPLAPTVASEWGLDAEFTLLATARNGAARGPPAMNVPPSDAGEMPVSDILDLLRSERRFVLLGDPGAGKTTTLRRLALETARARLADRASPLPLMLALPRWGAEPDLNAFISAHWPFESDARGAIAGGEVAVFLDGLNEMGREATAHVASMRHWLAGADAPHRLVVTCRTQDYDEHLDLRIDRVTVEPMDRDRIVGFATAYLKDDAPGLLARVLPGPERSDDPRSLFVLARNPYLLTSLMLLHKEGGELPRNTGRLFDRLVAFLWQRERLRQTSGWLPFEEGAARLARMAFRMIDSRMPTAVPREAFAAEIDDALIPFCISASILGEEGDRVRFYHQLMQEYFAAVALADVGVDNRLTDGRWREAIVALCGVVADPDALVQRVLAADARFAARCLMGGADVRDDTTRQVIHALVADYQATPARADEKERARADHLKSNPDMSTSSMHVMDDALDHHFGYPEADARELEQLFAALGPLALPWLNEDAGPAEAVLRHAASRV